MANYINGVDLSLLDFTVEDPAGYLDPPPQQSELIHVLRELGARKRSARLNERSFQINGNLKSATNAAVKANLRLLKALVLRGVLGVLEVELEDRPGYIARVEYNSFTSNPLGQAHQTNKWAVQMGFTAAKPPTWIYNTLSTVSGITSGGSSIPMGTAPPYSAVLAIYEPTNPTITFKDHNGVTVGTPMSFTMTPSAGEYLVIDFQLREIYRNTSGLPGTGTESSCDWTGGDFIEFDYHNWDPITQTWATLAISNGTGVLTYYPCDF